jgi:NADH-quinone oxidoreductase subunit L
MGGLAKYMPSTSTTFWIATLAISGIPLLSGFFSKDEILAKTFAAGHESSLYTFVWVIGVITAFLTAFYMTRVTYLTFNGKERFPQTAHPHESDRWMTTPLWILAGLAIVGGYVGLPAIIGHGKYNFISNSWLNTAVENRELHASLNTEVVLISLSIIIAVGGVLFAYNFYKNNEIEGDAKLARALGGLHRAMQQKFYVDEFYNKAIIRPFVRLSDENVYGFDRRVIEGIVNGTGSLAQNLGKVFRYLQGGIAQGYATLMMLGVILLLGLMMFL